MRPLTLRTNRATKPRHQRDPKTWYGLECWRRRAALQIMLEPFCRYCRQRGQLTRANLADHITPHRGNWNAFRLGPLQSLCSSCHSRDKRAQEHGTRRPVAIGLDGYAIEQQ